MGFQSVAFGLEICDDHLDLEALLRLCFQKVVCISAEEETSFGPDNYGTVVTLLCDNPSVYEVKGLLWDDLVVFEEDRREIYMDGPDLVTGDLQHEITHVKRSRIRIGTPHCCTTMIWLGCVGEADDPVEIDPLDVAFISVWRKNLVRDGRLAAGLKFRLVGNCCS